MPKRGQTLPWKMIFCWPGDKPYTRAFHSQEQAESAAERQRNQIPGVGDSDARCTVTISYRPKTPRKR